MDISIVIPAYNEHENIKKGVLGEVGKYLKGKKFTWEVLLVDDGSKDDTPRLLEDFARKNKGFFVFKEPHRGKAGTVIAGILRAKGEIALFTDMDQATPLNQLEKLLPRFDQGFDVVIGRRAGRSGAPIVRKISAFVFSLLRNLTLGLPFSDTQCGFKAFNQKAIQAVFPILHKNWKEKVSLGSAVNAGLDLEILFIAKKQGLKIADVPVEWHYVGTERVQLVSDAIEAIKDMLRIKLYDVQGKYQ